MYPISGRKKNFQYILFNIKKDIKEDDNRKSVESDANLISGMKISN